MATTGKTSGMTTIELEALLDTFGDERARWPLAQRAAAEALLATSPAARRLLAEAEALDRVLASASVPDADQLARLGDRIMAAAGLDPAVQSSPPATGNVIRLPQRGRPGARQPEPAGRPAAALVSGRPRPAAVRPVAGWQAAAALAASLVLGIAIGTTELPSLAAQGLFASAEARAGDTELVLASIGGDGFVGGVLPGIDEDAR
jgi:hypothetical protein